MRNLLNIDFFENGVSSIDTGNSVELIIKPLENQKTNFKVEVTTSSIHTHIVELENGYINYVLPFLYWNYVGVIKIRLLSNEGNSSYITITNNNLFVSTDNIIVKYSDGNYELSIVKKQGTSSVIDFIYPIGSVITNSKSTFNPNTLYPNTTWERIKGKVIVGVDENDSDFNTINKTGGAKTHTLTTAQMPSHTHTQNAHNHSASSSLQSQNHTHAWSGTTSSGGDHSHATKSHPTTKEAQGYGLTITGGFKNRPVVSTTTGVWIGPNGAHTHTVSGTTGGISANHIHGITVNNATATNQSTGSGQEHNNLQPYITKYVWERVA